MPWSGPTKERPFCSLGWELADLIPDVMCHGEGDLQGEPARIDHEMRVHIAECYRLNPLTGRRAYTEVVLSRPKGRAKSEVAAWIALAEAFLPVRFDYWGSDGQPVGREVRSPLIKCLATEEEQSGNTFKTIAFIAGEWGPGHHDPDVRGIYADAGGVRRYQSASSIYLPQGGEIRAATSGAASKDGGLETHIVADEPLALDTPLPTPGGWTTMGDLRAGDHVYGVDGQPVLVWGVSPVKYDRPCHRVTFDDGTSVVSDAAHRWWVFDRKGSRGWHETTTEAMMRSQQCNSKRFAVPRPQALAAPERDLALDPYVLGLWLGNGDSQASTLAVGRQDLDHVLGELDDRGFTASVYDYDHDRGVVVVRFNHGERYGKSGTSQHALRDLGVLRNKHVPDAYLWASVDQRLALLQGLMDSDGHVNIRGNCTFTNTSRALSDGVVHLARSLGWRASVGNWSSDERWGARRTGTWRVSFTPAGMVPFRLKRKAERCRTSAPSSNRTIACIEPAPSVPVRCIAVDSDDHLFLAGPGMLPTHNTHLYILRELRDMYATVSRNLGKRAVAEPWIHQTSTAYKPGERSVFEDVLSAWRKGELGPETYVNHVQATGRIDLNDAEHTKRQLRQVYGPAAEWIDLDRKIADMRNPRICRDAAEAARYFLNRSESGAEAWIAKDAVEAVRRKDLVLRADEPIAVGFDGSLNDDTTVFRAVRMSDGVRFRLGAWPKPEGPAGHGWVVPRAQVLRRIREVYRTYTVARGYFDPHEWRSDVEALAALFGDDRVIPWETNRDTAMAYALDRLHSDITNGVTFQDDDPLAVEHYGNAYVRKKGKLTLVRKEYPNSPRKIDTVVADALAYEARADALADGWTAAPKDTRVIIMR